MEELISFETAKLANEKGYIIASTTFFNRDFTIKSFQFHNIPTQSDLQKWLRETHNIDIIIKPWTGDTKNEKTYAADICIFNASYIKTQRVKTYEEALEIGLLNALYLIKDETIFNL